MPPPGPCAMKFFFDVLPFVLFYVSYVKWDIFVATAVAIGVSALQIVLTLLGGRKVEPMQWVGMGLIGVFGGLTLALRDPIFVMWRSSIVNWLLAAVLLVSLHVLGRNPLKLLLGGQMRMPELAWRQLVWGLSALFTTMGVINIIVAKNFSQSVWINYKTFGSTTISFLAIAALFMLLGRHIEIVGAPGSQASPATPPGDAPPPSAATGDAAAVQRPEQR
ncbi:septation protein A [Vandammella animalimorsus]|uniref:Inner membrane-spanning protein YciB n=2 Tax=Vandammella animalimorsus TaxID=2029117 RepID=A0A2A2AI01_9BURK|nr:septation protein A [Vandammella animalimorsus]